MLPKAVERPPFLVRFFRPYIRLLEVGIYRKGKWGRKARKRPPTKRTRSPAVILQRVGCICKAKGGVDLQRWVWIAKGGVILQRTFMSVARWGQNAKGQPKLP